jgi:hypothetical protein
VSSARGRVWVISNRAREHVGRRRAQCSHPPAEESASGALTLVAAAHQLIAATCRSTYDAHRIIRAVELGVLPITQRRLDGEERKALRSGDVWVWEERGTGSDNTGLGIERWTECVHHY